MSENLQERGRQWLAANGFASDSGTIVDSQWYGRAYTDYYGYGYVTFAFNYGTLGWVAQVSTGPSDDHRRINIAVCQSVEQMADLWRCLEQFDWDHRKPAEAQA